MQILTQNILADYFAYLRASSRQPHQRGPPATDAFTPQFHFGEDLGLSEAERGCNRHFTSERQVRFPTGAYRSEGNQILV